MHDHTRQLLVGVENDAVSPGRATAVDVVRLENGELVVRTLDGEVDTFIVVVLVRVVVAALGLARRVEAVSLLHRVVDGRLRVAGAAAGVGAVVARLELVVVGIARRRRGEGEGGAGEDLVRGGGLVSWFIDQVIDVFCTYREELHGEFGDGDIVMKQTVYLCIWLFASDWR